MTKEQWKQVEEALKNLYHSVKLQIDEYELALGLVRIGTYELAIMVYVGGQFKWEWLTEDTEERRRFCQKKERTMLTAKGKAALKKMSKKRQAEFASQCQYFYYMPYWKSFNSLKRHLIANNQSIELISIT